MAKKNNMLLFVGIAGGAVALYLLTKKPATTTAATVTVPAAPTAATTAATTSVLSSLLNPLKSLFGGSTGETFVPPATVAIPGANNTPTTQASGPTINYINPASAPTLAITAPTASDTASDAASQAAVENLFL